MVEEAEEGLVYSADWFPCLDNTVKQFLTSSLPQSQLGHLGHWDPCYFPGCPISSSVIFASEFHPHHFLHFFRWIWLTDKSLLMPKNFVRIKNKCQSCKITLPVIQGNAHSDPPWSSHIIVREPKNRLIIP